MLPFVHSPDDHRSWILEVRRRSILSKHPLKIAIQPERRLVSTQLGKVKNAIT